MNVKEAISLLKSAKKITLYYGLSSVEIYPDDELAVAAYGRFRVKEVQALSVAPETYELTIAMQPVME